MDGKNRADGTFGRIIGPASAQNAAGLSFEPFRNSAGVEARRSSDVHRSRLEQFVLNLKASNHRAGMLCWMRFYSLKHNPFVIAIHPLFILQA
jgi:hypothetical protein